MNTILGALRSGLPLLFTQLAVTLVLLAIGVGCYLAPCQGKRHKRWPREAESTDGPVRRGPPHSSDEAG
jgi:hypothetical protein